MEELKHCPFCPDGGHPYPRQLFLVGTNIGFRITCGDCESSTGIHSSKEAAAKAWNTRAERTCKIKPWRMEEYTGFYDCLECDCGHVMDGYEWARATYCPNCGLKVVS